MESIRVSCEPGEEEMISSMKSVRSKLLDDESYSEVNDIFLGSGKIGCSDCERYVGALLINQFMQSGI